MEPREPARARRGLLTGSSSSTGVAFYPPSGGPYPASCNGAVFFADYSRRCIWAMPPSTPGGLPKGRRNYVFASWSDGGAQTHDVVAPHTATTYTATYRG